LNVSFIIANLLAAAKGNALFEEEKNFKDFHLTQREFDILKLETRDRTQLTIFYLKNFSD
jgi:hypothetical protein